MTWFETSTESASVVAASPEQVWAVLSDPGLVAELTPMVRAIEADGEHWHWRLAGINVLGHRVSPSFTVHMDMEPPRRIDFTHEPVGREHAGVDGWYALEPAGDGTRLAIRLTVKVDLHLPRLSGPAVRAAMHSVIAAMGAGFSRNLIRHLGA